MDCGTMKNKDTSKSVLELALDMQKECGWVTEEAVKEIASLRKMPESRIYETLSFYSMILLDAPAEVRIEFCRGTSCYIADGVNLLEEIQNITNCTIDECSKDGKYQLEYCECLGHCETAPNVVVNGRLYTSVTKESIKNILKEASL